MSSTARPDPASQLIRVFYPELRRLAAIRMKGERANHTWQPTTLVHELYLELARIKTLRLDYDDEQSRQAFMRLAAHLMKRLLIHHARPLAKRAVRVDVSDCIETGEPNPEDLSGIENLLDRLGAINPKFRTVVEMKVFEGLSISEIAVVLGCTNRTVDRYWAFCRQWLAEQLSPSV